MHALKERQIRFLQIIEVRDTVELEIEGIKVRAVKDWQCLQAVHADKKSVQVGEFRIAEL